MNRNKILEQLVLDCSRFDFTEEEALSYISERAGVGIQRTRYYAIKKRIKNSEVKASQDRMMTYAKSGFLVNHFRRIDEAEHLQSILFKSLHNEMSRPPEKQNPLAISKVASIVVANSNYLFELNLGSPIIDQMKKYIEEKLNGDSIHNPAGYSPSGPQDNLMGTSACVLPEDFFGPNYVNKATGGRIQIGKDPPDRVF